MMRQAWVAMRVAALCALLVACGSTPPTRYYVLSADALPAPAPAGSGPSLGIAELNVAEYLQRPQLVSMESANRLRVQDFERWAEPLGDGVQRTLALNLSALLATDAVRLRPWPREWKPEWVLRVSIARLDVKSETIEMVAAWSLAHGAAVQEHTSRLTRARSGTSADTAAADISALLLELSEQIAAAVGAGANDTSAQGERGASRQEG